MVYTDLYHTFMMLGMVYCCLNHIIVLFNLEEQQIQSFPDQIGPWNQAFLTLWSTRLDT